MMRAAVKSKVGKIFPEMYVLSVGDERFMPCLDAYNGREAQTPVGFPGAGAFPLDLS